MDLEVDLGFLTVGRAAVERIERTTSKKNHRTWMSCPSSYVA